MPHRTLLTGGTGFIAAHIIERLLLANHSVVATVRSHDKAQYIKSQFPSYSTSQLSFAIVPDITAPGAFDEAVVSDPPFDTVIHTASPVTFTVTDAKTELVDPAINGTKNILFALKKSAPSVKRLVITSSYAAMVDSGGKPPGYRYSESDWNPIKLEDVPNSSIIMGYRAGKTFGEKFAWDYVSRGQTEFDLIVINPPMVFGPLLLSGMKGLSGVNLSNQFTRDAFLGKFRDGELPKTAVHFWVDVRDLADAHIRALDITEAGGKRFFVTAGNFKNLEIADIIRNSFPDHEATIPLIEDRNGLVVPSFNNERSKKILGINYRTLEESIIDTVNCFKQMSNKPNSV